MKIIIVDKFEAWGVEQLKGLASELAIETELKGDALKDRIAAFDPDVLVVRSTKIPESIITACKKLLLIVRAGSGGADTRRGACRVMAPWSRRSGAA